MKNIKHYIQERKVFHFLTTDSRLVVGLAGLSNPGGRHRSEGGSKSRSPRQSHQLSFLINREEMFIVKM
jgi:hypothetical protein